MGGRYVLLDRLGSGAFSEVFRAHDLRVQREVALKLLRPEHVRQTDGASPAEALAAEASALAQVPHPGLVKVLDAGELEGVPFLTMEVVRGRALSVVLSEAGRLPVRRAVRITAQICDVLAHAHAKGLVHRDVKPANVLIEDGDHVRVIDFGLAQFRRSLHDGAPDALAGTPSFMASELFRGEPPSPSTDLFGVGATLHALLVGSEPFPGGGFAEIVQAVRECRPTPVETLRPDVPRAVARIVRKALAKSPADRYHDAADMARDLRRSLWARPVRRAGAAAIVAAVVTWAGVRALAPPLAMDVELIAIRQQGTASGAVMLLPAAHAALQAGDDVRGRVRVNRPAYVFGVWLNAAGEPVKWFPSQDRPLELPLKPLKAGGFHEIHAGQWEAAAAPEVETLFVVATTDPEARAALEDVLARAAALPSSHRGLSISQPAERERVEAFVDAALRQRFPVVKRWALEQSGERPPLSP